MREETKPCIIFCKPADSTCMYNQRGAYCRPPLVCIKRRVVFDIEKFLFPLIACQRFCNG